MQTKLGTGRYANAIWSIAVSCIAMISLPLSLNFGVLASTVFGTYLMINTLFGAYAYILLSKKSSFNFAELLGLGIAFGTAVPALINILVRLSGITWGSTAPFFPIIGTIVFLLQKSRSVAPKIYMEPISSADLCMILASPIFAIVAWSDRMWPFCAVLLLTIAIILMFEQQTQKAKWINYFPFLIFIGGAFINTTTNHLFNRELIWKSQTGVDIAFDEAQSWSVSHFGFYDNVLLAGQPTKGHILTQAWAGDFASFTNAPKFVSTAMTGYGVGILGLAAILYFLTYEMSKRKIAARIAITLFLLQASIPEQFLALPSPRVANSLSMLWLAVFWFLYTANHAKQVRYSTPTLMLAMFVVSLAKFQWGLIAALTIWITAITQSRDLKGVVVRCWKPAVIAITLPITYLLFLKGMDAREGVVFKLQVGMLPLLLVVLLTRTSLVKLPRDVSDQSQLLHKFYLISTIFAVLFIWVTNAGNQATYFFYPVLWLSASHLGMRIDKIFTEKRFSRNRLLSSTFWGICSGVCICVSYYYLHNRLTDNTKYPTLRWIYVSHPEILQPLALAIFLVISIIFALLKTKRQTYSAKTLTHLLIPLIIVFNISSNFSNWFLTSNASSITKIWFDVNNSPDYANNSDQYRVADWIIQNTGQSEIGASNFLCDIQVDVGGKTPSLNIGSKCKDRNMLAWISALTHRRMLIDAPLTSLMGTGATLEEEFRVNYNAVLAFGSHADSRSFAILQRQGVTWFVVDREQSNVSTWQPYGDIVFSTSRYFVLRIPQ